MGEFDEPLQFFQASLSLKQSDQLFNLQTAPTTDKSWFHRLTFTKSNEPKSGTLIGINLSFFQIK